MTPQKRFADDHGMDLGVVKQLASLASKAGKANEHCCNGDPHPARPIKTDKNANAEDWGRDVDHYSRQILELVKPYGFTGVEYTGLYPTLKRGDKFVEIPY